MSDLHELMGGLRIRHTLVDLPAYSPQLNPIESVFSTWKAYVKKLESVAMAQSKQKNLLQWIEETTKEVKNREKAAGFYRHVIRYYIHCVQEKPLDEHYSPHLLVE